ncbi:MAG: hypothetical protein JNL87_09300 [Burkholderiaceae bacterium]|nr:hypothetical protein [Burkholderiaceae bacterium]
MAIAAARARRLSDADVKQQRAIVETALGEFSRGIRCAFHWNSLADVANVAQTLAGMGLGSGREADAVTGAAQGALQAVHQRQAAGGSWTLYATELDALTWLVRLHTTVQLPACSYGEFDEAFRATHRRLRQTLAGNASPGAVLVAGDLAGDLGGRLDQRGAL